MLFPFVCRSSSFCLHSDRAIYDLYCTALARLIVTDEFALLKKLHPRYAPHLKKKPTATEGFAVLALPGGGEREKGQRLGV